MKTRYMIIAGTVMAAVLVADPALAQLQNVDVQERVQASTSLVNNIGASRRPQSPHYPYSLRPMPKPSE